MRHHRVVLRVMTRGNVIDVTRLASEVGISRVAVHQSLRGLRRRKTIILISKNIRSPKHITRRPSRRMGATLTVARGTTVNGLTTDLIRPKDYVCLSTKAAALTVTRRLVRVRSLAIIAGSFIVTGCLLSGDGYAVVRANNTIYQRGHSYIKRTTTAVLHDLVVSRTFVSTSS